MSTGRSGDWLRRPAARASVNGKRIAASAIRIIIAAILIGGGDGRRAPRNRSAARSAQVSGPADHRGRRAAGAGRAEIARDALVQYRDAVQPDVPALLYRIVAEERPARLSERR